MLTSRKGRVEPLGSLNFKEGIIHEAFFKVVALVMCLIMAMFVFAACNSGTPAATEAPTEAATEAPIEAATEAPTEAPAETTEAPATTDEATTDATTTDAPTESTEAVG